MTPQPPGTLPAQTPMPRVIIAASTGTVFEYYDFLLYGSLATFFGALFFLACFFAARGSSRSWCIGS